MLLALPEQPEFSPTLQVERRPHNGFDPHSDRLRRPPLPRSTGERKRQPQSLAPFLYPTNVGESWPRSGRSGGLKALVTIAMLLLLAGCGQSMEKQKKYDTYAPADIFQNGSSAQQPPEGTVPQSEPARAAALKNPPQVTEALLKRGRKRFNIFCAPCHGFDGDGDGMVVQRGFPAPPSYHSKALMQAPASHFLDVIANGYGVMYSYGDRVPPTDRWAIVAYIRALQLSKHASAADARQAGVSLE